MRLSHELLKYNTILIINFNTNFLLNLELKFSVNIDVLAGYFSTFDVHDATRCINTHFVRRSHRRQKVVTDLILRRIKRGWWVKDGRTGSARWLTERRDCKTTKTRRHCCRETNGDESWSECRSPSLSPGIYSGHHVACHLRAAAAATASALSVKSQHWWTATWPFSKLCGVLTDGISDNRSWRWRPSKSKGRK